MAQHMGPILCLLDLSLHWSNIGCMVVPYCLSPTSGKEEEEESQKGIEDMVSVQLLPHPSTLINLFSVFIFFVYLGIDASLFIVWDSSLQLILEQFFLMNNINFKHVSHNV